MLKFLIKFIQLRIPVAWNDRFRYISGEHKQIASGFAVVAVFILLGKMVAAAKEIAIAWRYGISETVDAYLFTFNLAQWPVNVAGWWQRSSIPVSLKSDVKIQVRFALMPDSWLSPLLAWYGPRDNLLVFPSLAGDPTLDWSE